MILQPNNDGMSPAAHHLTSPNITPKTNVQFFSTLHDVVTDNKAFYSKQT